MDFDIKKLNAYRYESYHRAVADTLPNVEGKAIVPVKCIVSKQKILVLTNIGGIRIPSPKVLATAIEYGQVTKMN